MNRNESQLNESDASHWKLGLLYYNPRNPKLVIPKRFGWGWTFNFAHKATWLFLLAVVVIVVVVRVWK